MNEAEVWVISLVRKTNIAGGSWRKLSCPWWVIDFFECIFLRLFHPKKTVHPLTLFLWQVSRNVSSSFLIDLQTGFEDFTMQNLCCRFTSYISDLNGKLCFPVEFSTLKWKSEFLNAHRLWKPAWGHTRTQSHDTGQLPTGGSSYNPAYLEVGSWRGCSDGLSCELYSFVLLASQQNCLLLLEWLECFWGRLLRKGH